MVVFCIALTGLCPLVIMQSKQLAKMQTWMQPQTTNYLVPASNTWARKLGATATLQSTLPGPSGAGPAGTVVNAVSIISLTRNLNSQQVSVQVSVQALVTP
jgi:hypothetical protein